MVENREIRDPESHGGRYKAEGEIERKRTETEREKKNKTETINTLVDNIRLLPESFARRPLLQDLRRRGRSTEEICREANSRSQRGWDISRSQNSVDTRWSQFEA